ncbi:AraC family transcriptional regulator [Rhodococcus marinonascens]|uniref:AraC family transcriptional regulator n=1 Tax=Rhodococcus marinonascens TaxID=38311 RepID=UPI0009322EE4|nr:AraC family transcriptional regulator [Rhodococcus marinonascens]
MTARTIPADFVRRALEMSSRSGVDLSPALSAAGLTTASLSDPLARLTPTQVTAFTQAVWQITDDELFGLGPAPVPRGTFRLVCLALIHTEDLSAALERMADILHALPALPALHIASGSNGGTRMTIDIRPGAAKQTEDAHLSLEAARLTTDFLLILLHRFAAWLVGKRVPLLAVELPYPPPVPRLAENYDHIFGIPVDFDSHIPAIEFDNAVMRSPIIQNEQTLENYLRESPTLLMSERDYDSAASTQVRRVLELGLKGRTSTAEDIAQMLSISVPHLRRLLRQEGTSLNQLREEVLRDAAVAGLRRGETVEDLSARLGFSESSAFRRAFKRWTGGTPSSYR